MAWTDTGTVNVTRTNGSGLHRVRFQWESGASGAVLNMRQPLVGVLDHFVAHKVSGALPYSVWLYSGYDVDVLNAQGVNLGTALVGPTQIRKLLDGADLPRSIVVMGNHTFRTGAVSLVGTFDLYYYPDLAMALERRGMY